MPLLLPDDLRLGAVGLAVRDLDQALAFYTRKLGMTLRTRTAATAALGTPARTLVELAARSGAERDPDAAGLFHLALLLPSRADLGRCVRHLAAEEVPLTGMADHVVSEALYLDDPDGHGIEIYADRPRDAWYRDGRFQLANRPLDLDGLAADGADAPWRGLPEGTVMGHVHLESHDLAASRRFYTEALGFDVMAEWRQAVFLSKGGYHHHLAVNDWRRRRHPLADAPDRIGLLYYTVELPEAAPLAAALPEAERQDGVLVVRDPAGIPIRFAVA